MALSHWPQLARDGDGGGTGSVPRCRVSGMALGAGAMESPPHLLHASLQMLAPGVKLHLLSGKSRRIPQLSASSLAGSSERLRGAARATWKAPAVRPVRSALPCPAPARASRRGTEPGSAPACQLWVPRDRATPPLPQEPASARPGQHPLGEVGRGMLPAARLTAGSLPCHGAVGAAAGPQPRLCPGSCPCRGAVGPPAAPPAPAEPPSPVLPGKSPGARGESTPQRAASRLRPGGAPGRR